jgi:hypothetical protein
VPLVIVFHYYDENQEALAVDLLVKTAGQAVNGEKTSLCDFLVWKKLAVKNSGAEEVPVN